jgi:transcriptional regulator with GAF, ATPase, and Fis domain
MASDASAKALQELSTFLVTDAPMGETLRRVADLTVGAIPGAELAGIAMIGSDGRPATSVFTDERSPEMDSAQYESGRGPCLDAWRERRTVSVEDLEAAKDQHPEFADLALKHGIRSTLSFGLAAGGVGIGALNLYAPETHAFRDEDSVVGEQLAAAAAVLLANVSAYWTAFEMSEGLTRAMQSRSVIEQAKGMLMARNEDMDAEGAFDVLRRASMRENVKIRDIAERIVARRPNPEQGS